MHTHACPVCFTLTASHAGALDQCSDKGPFHCVMHHPDPAIQRDWRPYMTHPIVRAVEDTAAHKG